MTVAQKIDPSLFAQKGQARPAVTATDFTDPLRARCEAPKTTSLPEKARSVVSLLGLRPVEKPKPSPEPRAEVHRSQPEAQYDRRVAMTLRLSLAQHLRLKFFCRRTGRTAQDVMETAVFEYIRKREG